MPSFTDRKVPKENAEFGIMEKSPLWLFSHDFWRKNGHISDVQREILRYWFGLVEKNKLANLNIDRHICIKTPPETRTSTREQHLTELYAQQLETSH
jgi:hypothetical protein